MLRDAKLLVYLRQLLMYLLMEVLTILTRYATTRPLRVGYIRFHTTTLTFTPNATARSNTYSIHARDDARVLCTSES